MSTNNIAYLNGEFLPHGEANLSIDDRGTLFSDGVYEVVYARDSEFIDWDWHFERMMRSLAGLKINLVLDSTVCLSEAKELLKRNNVTQAGIYWQITRGVAPRNHPFPNPEVRPTELMTVLTMPQAVPDIPPLIKVVTCPDERWVHRHLKTISLLPNILAKQTAVEQGADEAVLIEKDDTVTEGSSTNVFIVNSHGDLITHPANGAILGGVTRARILLLAKQKGINTVERAFTKQELMQAHEVFITSTTAHVRAVSYVDNTMIKDGLVGNITQKIHTAYQDFINQSL